MNEQLYTHLSDQIARQTPEFAALDADIAARQPAVDALQAAVDAAQAALDAASEEDKAAASEALAVAQQALAGPKHDLDLTKAQADAIRSAIAGCQAALDASGLTVDTAAVKLAQDKATMWTRIKAHRERLSDTGGYTTNGKWFHSDVKSKAQQMALVMAGAGVPPVPWKTMDGTFITMSQSLALAIFQAAMTQEAAIFARAEQHRAAMESSANPMAYDFSGGWPATFGS